MGIQRRITGVSKTAKRGRQISAPTRKGQCAPFILELVYKAQESKQLTDPFANQYGVGMRGAIEPVYPFMRLAQLILQSNILRQCIESYVINTESNGYTLEYIGPAGQEHTEGPQDEKRRLEAFLEFPSSEMTLRQMREWSRWDLEGLGNRFFEIVRTNKGTILEMVHIPAVTMRVTKRDLVPTEVTITIPDPDDDGFTTRKVMRHFRRFVQIGYSGKRVFFKEFGDPRSISPVTGDVDKTLAPEQQATEVHWDYLYAPGSVYGLPRYIGQIPSILGCRESEMVNLNFFRDNAIPAMTVLVSGGALTEDSFDRIEDYINATRGQDSMQRVMVLEAAADDNAGSIDTTQPAPKIDMKPMISERQQDGLFQDYDEKGQGKVRSSFRLPPIYVGRAEDYTRASALASMLTAENQVFAPERTSFDDLMNRFVLFTYRPKFWKFKTLAPSLNEPQSLATMLKAFGDQGALTPNVVIKIANKMLDSQIEPIVEDWGNAPFNYILASVQAGKTIKGLDKFVEEIDQTVGTGGNDTGNEDNLAGNGKDKAPKPNATPQDTVKSTLRKLNEDLKEAAGNVVVLQTSARKRARVRSDR